MAGSKFQLTIPTGFLDSDLEAMLPQATEYTHGLMILNVQTIRLLRRLSGDPPGDVPAAGIPQDAPVIVTAPPPATEEAQPSTE